MPSLQILVFWLLKMLHFLYLFLGSLLIDQVLYLENLYCMFMFAFLIFSCFIFHVFFLTCRASAEEAILRTHGTMIGQQIVRLSWGRSPSSKQVCIMALCCCLLLLSCCWILIYSSKFDVFSVDCLLFTGSSSYGKDLNFWSITRISLWMEINLILWFSFV